MSAEGEPKSKEKKNNSRDRKTVMINDELPKKFAFTVTCGDSVPQEEKEGEKLENDVQLGVGDDEVKPDGEDGLEQKEDWETYLDTVGLIEDESDKVEEEEKKQQTIWDQLEPSEANLNKLDGWGAKVNLSSTKVETISPSSEILSDEPDDLSTATTSGHENENGKRVRWADIEKRLQSQQGPDIMSRYPVESSL